MRIAAPVFTLAAILAASPCLAQEARGTITGRVIDSSGAVIAGASVKVINEGTNVAVPLITNEQGIYNAPLLVPGTYKVSAAAAGFKNYVRGGIELHVEDRLEIEVKMELGVVSDTV